MNFSEETTMLISQNNNLLGDELKYCNRSPSISAEDLGAERTRRNVRQLLRQQEKFMDWRFFGVNNKEGIIAVIRSKLGLFPEIENWRQGEERERERDQCV